MPSLKNLTSKGLQPSETPAYKTKAKTTTAVQNLRVWKNLRFISVADKIENMGTPTGDNDVVFGNDCLNRFDAGETPKFLTLRLTGMQQGDDWVPADGAPPNLEVTIEQNVTVACLFFENIDLNDFFILFGIAVVTVSIDFDVFGNIFFGQVFTATAIVIPNSLNNPVGSHFYGGEAAIGILPGDDTTKFHGVQDALNMEHSSETFGSVFAAETDKAVFRFGRGSDGTNISIKTEE